MINIHYSTAEFVLFIAIIKLLSPRRLFKYQGSLAFVTCVNATLNTSIHKIAIELPQENEMPGCLLIDDAGRLVGQPDDISCRLHFMGRKIALGGTVASFALR